MIMINYFEFSQFCTDKLLGSLILNGINEVITPLFKDNIDNQKAYPVFMTKSFIGRKEHRWELKKSEVEHINNRLIINIWLFPKNNSGDIYLSQTLKIKIIKALNQYYILVKLLLLNLDIFLLV